MYQRYFIPPKESFFLFGPRGVGKSTWIKKLFPQALCINLLEPNELRYYASYPERLRETLAANPDKILFLSMRCKKHLNFYRLSTPLLKKKKVINLYLLVLA